MVLIDINKSEQVIIYCFELGLFWWKGCWKGKGEGLV